MNKHQAQLFYEACVFLIVSWIGVSFISASIYEVALNMGVCIAVWAFELSRRYRMMKRTERYERRINLKF